MRSTVKAVVLSGGKSKRMGRDKSFLNIGDVFLLDIIVKKLKLVFDDIYVVINSSSKFQNLSANLLTDIFSEKGPLGGIYTALELIDANYIFVFACDMPFLNTGLIEYMVGKIDKQYNAIVPLINRRAEPLHAIYSQGSKDTVKDSVVQNRLSVHSLFNKFSTLYVQEEEIKEFGNNMFFNVNTLEDYKKALEIAGDAAKN
ncbi:MAG: molybdenum cofactor guanylyltransferase [Candidatus Cloacimonadota bacterium]|nr:MAG: molybdenum cofactor guanylyltransferase [Candidatus Cloacimonadota bacterium]